MKTQMDKTLSFTVEDALLSPLGFSVLSGAGLFGQATDLDDPAIVHVHMTTSTTITTVDEQLSVDLTGALGSNEEVDDTAPIFIAVAEADGSLSGDLIEPRDGSAFTVTNNVISNLGSGEAGDMVFVDYYIQKNEDSTHEMQIDVEHFAGYYYVEADTLFRRQADGVDMPAVLTFPNVKIQSNFTFTMASTGDPSTFTFTMDAFPGYTLFDKTKKVLCVMQVIDDTEENIKINKTVMEHYDTETFSEAQG